jgi:hypothetical protein
MYSFIIPTRSTQKAISASLLAWFICLQLPWSFSPQSLIPYKQTGEAFFCMGRSCGCMTAEQCWKNCCCSTQSQRIAWATKNGHKIPGWVLVKSATLTEESETETKLSTASGKPHACCLKDADSHVTPTSSVTCTKTSEKTPSCCSKKSSSKQTPKTAPGLVWEQVQKCQGQQQFWALVSTIAPVSHTAHISFAHELCETLMLSNARIASQADQPAIPPPRFMGG